MASPSLTAKEYLIYKVKRKTQILKYFSVLWGLLVNSDFWDDKPLHIEICIGIGSLVAKNTVSWVTNKLVFVGCEKTSCHLTFYFIFINLSL